MPFFDDKLKKMFVNVFLITSFVFLYYTVHFLFGNHDWHYLTLPVRNREFLEIGRWLFGFVANYAGGHVLPVINSSFSFAALSCAAVLFVRYIDFEIDLFSSVLVCLMITLLPSIVGVLYFQYMIFPYFVAILCGVSALLLTRGGHFLNLLCAVLLICCSLALYGNALNSIAVIFIAGIISKLIQRSSELQTIGKLFKPILKELVVLFLGGCLYIISLFFLKKMGMLTTGEGQYATSVIGLKDFFGNFLNMAPVSFFQLMQSQPFFPQFLKITLLSLVLFSFLLLIVTIFRQKDYKYRKIALSLISCVLLVLATKAVFFLNSNIGWAQDNFRYSYFGMSFFYSFCACVALYLSRGYINIFAKIMICVLLFTFAVQDLNAQKMWKIASEQERLFQNRLLNRIETASEFDITKQYTYLTLGNYLSFGTVLINKSYKYESAIGEFIEMTSPLWGPSQGLTYLNPSLKIKDAPNIHLDYLNQFNSYADFFKKNKDILFLAKPWPHPNSVFIIDDVILVVMDQQYLDRARKLAVQ